MDLFPHQQDILTLNPDRYLLAHGTGTGKTLMAVALAKIRNEVTLVICPKHLKEKWERDIRVLKEFTLILTKEEFKKREMVLPYCPTVIVDEAHTFFGTSSQLHKSLVRYFKRYNTPYRYFLTATPYLSTPWNIYAAAVLMGETINYAKFRNTFFHEIRMGHRFVWKAKEDAGSKAKLRKIIERLGSGVQLSDVFDVPEQTHEVIFLELTAEQKKLIKENYDPVAIVQWTAAHRIENSGGPKLEWLKEFAKTHKKFVVWCRYLSQIKELQEELPHTYVIHGGIDNRDEVIQRANREDECILIIQAQCSEGFELPTFDTAVYASMSFSYKDKVQSQGRILRANALHENMYYYLTMKGGVDEEVKKALDSKTDFSFELLSTH